jgi:hypothetical protein
MILKGLMIVGWGPWGRGGRSRGLPIMQQEWGGTFSWGIQGSDLVQYCILGLPPLPPPWRGDAVEGRICSPQPNPKKVVTQLPASHFG